MVMLQKYLGANKRRHRDKRHARKKVAGRSNRSKLNAAKRKLQRSKRNNLSTERQKFSTARQNTSKTKQLSTTNTKGLREVINCIKPYGRITNAHALSTEHPQNITQPVTTKGHLSTKVKPVFFDTDV
jgi:hypothetical protein